MGGRRVLVDKVAVEITSGEVLAVVDAAVDLAKPSAGDLEVKVVGALCKIASVDGLNNHLKASSRRVAEFHVVASACTFLLLGSVSSEAERCKSVRERGALDDWRVAFAGVAVDQVSRAVPWVAVGLDGSVRLADLDYATGAGRLAGPRECRFAAIPVACGASSSESSGRSGGGSSSSGWSSGCALQTLGVVLLLHDTLQTRRAPVAIRWGAITVKSHFVAHFVRFRGIASI